MTDPRNPPAISTGELPPTIDRQYGGARGFNRRCQEVLNRLNRKDPVRAAEFAGEQHRHSWRRPFSVSERLVQKARGAAAAMVVWLGAVSGWGSAAIEINEAHFAALSQVESRHRDRAVGAAGEVSRYQLTPANWRRLARAGERPDNPAHARRVAERFWRAELASTRCHWASTNPTSKWAIIPPRDMYALWHRPGAYRRAGCSVDALPAIVRQRCDAYARAYAAAKAAKERP